MCDLYIGPGMGYKVHRRYSIKMFFCRTKGLLWLRRLNPQWVYSMGQKVCFGVLDKVFPKGKEGLREVVPACFQCPERTPCLRAALSTKEGLEMRAKNLERVEEGGWIGGLKRWSLKKALSRQIKEKEKRK